MKTSISSLVACFVAATMLVSPLAYAQDDDMPDGDVDLVEKPKPKKKDPAPPPPKKEEKKKKEESKEPPKKEEPKKEEPRKEEPKEAPKKEEPKKRPELRDDDDILTGGDDPPKKTPPKKEEPAKPEKSPILTEDDEEEGGGRLLIGEEPLEKEGGAFKSGTPIKAESNAQAKPIVSSDQPDDLPDDEPPPKKIVREDKDNVRTIETRVDEPDESEEGSGGVWVAVGGTAAAVVLLAGAGVGGYFLVSALGPQTGTVVVTPR